MVADSEGAEPALPDQHKNLIYVAWALIAIGIGLRLFNLIDNRLWGDEIFSVALAESPLLDVLVSAVRYDVHPPLYYLQLHFWQYFSRSDTWYVVNSLLWNLAAMASVFVVCRRIYDRETAIFTAALFAILPQQVFFAETVRMYAMAMVLILWTWYFVEEYIRNSNFSRRDRVILVALGAAFNLIHGVAFIVIGCLGIYGLVRLIETRQKHRIATFIILFTLIEIFAAYSLVIGALRSTVGLQEFDLSSIGINLTMTILGYNIPYPQFAGVLAFVAFVIPCLFIERARMVAGILFVFPLAAFLVISLTVKPIFGFRPLSMFTPFLIIALALGVRAAVTQATAKPLLRYWALSVPIVFLLAALNFSATYEKENYAAISNYWAKHSKKGEALYVDADLLDFWGLLRYLDGADLNSALDIQPPQKDKWKRVHTMMGQPWVERLNLAGNSTEYSYRDRTIYPFLWSDYHLEGPDEFWIFRRGIAGCDLDEYVLDSAIEEKSFSLSLCRKI